MADVKNSAEPTFPTKRIPDSTTQDSTNEPKKQKLDNPENNLDNNGIQPQQNDDVQKEKQQVEEEEIQEELSSGKAVIDRKGKGILIEEDDEEDEDVDEDDSDDDSDSDDSVIGDDEEDSDFADDPLAEVDLDNILPSRTRRKVIHPGVYLRNDIPQDDDSDDDIDDPDA
ncbi:hypothetical protein BVRB_6g152080 [Beta vulgaris subsp. vulgaris]|nr:hypothetical protein BVRB_6g152080 [Beta vulgaris subsp. vulgaris]